MSRRPYEELQRIVEQEGGQIVFERAGHSKGGAYVVTLQDNQKVFRSQGPAGFPPMDQLYVPKVQSPVHYSDYSRTLIPGAREKWLEILGAPSHPQPDVPRDAPFVVSPLPLGTPPSAPPAPPAEPVVLPPLSDAAEYVSRINASRGLPERNMEDLVKDLLVRLGHPAASILFQVGHIDVLVHGENGKPRFVTEVKRSLRPKVDRDSALRQGFDYASRNGAPLVVITDADAYEIYDRRAGLDHASMLQANFRLTAFREKDLPGFDLLRP